MSMLSRIDILPGWPTPGTRPLSRVGMNPGTASAQIGSRRHSCPAPDVVETALVGLKAGRLADEVAAPSTEAVSRRDIRADTEWLLLVADAYADRVGRVVIDDRPECVGA
ncbi:hypothetical protein [Streptomyces sp. NPDC013740]|uniref:hypothetical protein n=1 Tax=Streptomyces sp. NPDC013740 TaxID=3364867 RepID=UPI0036F53E7F